MAIDSTYKEWQSVSGLKDDTTTTPESYAKRLVSYIRDPSTVYIRVKERWGASPSREWIAGQRAKWEDENEWRSVEQKKPSIESKPFFVKSVEKTEIEKRRESFRVKAIREPALMGGAVAARCYRALGIRGYEANKHLKNETSKRATALVLTCLVGLGLSDKRAGEYYQSYTKDSVIRKIRLFFSVYLKDEKMMRAWKEVAPHGFSEVNSLEEFRRMIGEVK